MAIYSLLTISKDHGNGKIDGQWLQDSVGDLEEAIKRARHYERIRNFTIGVAVVNCLPSTVPSLANWTNRTRLDN